MKILEIDIAYPARAAAALVPDLLEAGAVRVLGPWVELVRDGEPREVVDEDGEAELLRLLQRAHQPSDVRHGGGRVEVDPGLVAGCESERIK